MMFTLKFSAVVVILGVACNADSTFRYNALNLRNIQMENAMTLQMEQQKLRQEAMLLQLKAAEEQRNLAINLQTEAWKRALEQQQLQRDFMQQTLFPSADDNGISGPIVLPANLNMVTTNPQIMGYRLNSPLNPAPTTLANTNLLNPAVSPFIAGTTLTGSMPFQSQFNYAVAAPPPAIMPFSSPAQFSASRALTTSTSPFTSFSMPASYPLRRRGVLF